MGNSIASANNKRPSNNWSIKRRQVGCKQIKGVGEFSTDTSKWELKKKERERKSKSERDWNKRKNHIHVYIRPWTDWWRWNQMTTPLPWRFLPFFFSSFLLFFFCIDSSINGTRFRNAHNSHHRVMPFFAPLKLLFFFLIFTTLSPLLSFSFQDCYYLMPTAQQRENKTTTTTKKRANGRNAGSTLRHKTLHLFMLY